MTAPSRTPSDVTIATCSCCGQQMHPADWKERMLAQLSQSRDDALEDAARVCKSVFDNYGDDDAAMICADKIRSLKTKPAPIAAPIASGDAGDAARYRWLRNDATAGEWEHLNDIRLIAGTEMDTQVDAAIRKGAE